MNFLRKMVSGKRRRIENDKYNLDITYITPRIIATSYPSVGVEAAFRNPIQDVRSQFLTKYDQVAQFLTENHGDKYWVFNCSERNYDKTPFENRGSDFNWKDHHAP